MSARFMPIVIVASIPIVIVASIAAFATAPAFASAADAQKLPPCVEGQPIPPGGCRKTDTTPPAGALGELRPAPPLNAPDAPVPVAPAPPLNSPNAPVPVAPAPPLTVPAPSITPRAPSATPRAPSESPSVVTPPPTGDGDIARKPPRTGDRMPLLPPPAPLPK